jgi:hypothetical protein
MLPNRWTIDGNAIDTAGAGFNKRVEVVLFKFDEVEYKSTSRKSVISFDHSSTSVGTLRCQPQYTPGKFHLMLIDKSKCKGHFTI